MKRFLLYNLVFFALCSCATQRPITSAVNPANIKKVMIVPPINSIKVLYAQSDEIIEDEDYFNEVQKSGSKAIKKFLDNYKIEYDDLSANREEENMLAKEVAEYYTKMDGPERRNAMIGDVKFNHQANRDACANIIISDNVANLIKANNQRFALATITIGFTRSKKNERNRQYANAGKAALGVGLAVLTGTFLFIRGIPYKSVTYFFLIDAEQKNIAMYSKKTEEIDPTNESSLQWQINSGLEEYWIWHAAKLNGVKRY
jgi:hypothetical protein